MNEKLICPECKETVAEIERQEITAGCYANVTNWLEVSCETTKFKCLTHDVDFERA